MGLKGASLRPVSSTPLSPGAFFLSPAIPRRVAQVSLWPAGGDYSLMGCDLNKGSLTKQVHQGYNVPEL